MSTVASDRPASKASNRASKPPSTPPARPQESRARIAQDARTRETTSTSPARAPQETPRTDTSTAAARAAGAPAPTRSASSVLSPKDQVSIDDPTLTKDAAKVSQGIDNLYGGPARATHDHGNHGGHGDHGNHDNGGHHHDDENPYWTGTPLGTERPNPNVPETPPPGLSDAEKELYEFRRQVGPEHVKWHNDMAMPGTETEKDHVDFFDYHRGLLENDNAERERLGLPPLGAMDPPPPEQLCPKDRNGNPLKGQDGKPIEVDRPDPLDPKYKGNFEAFAKDMRRYHDLYHGMNPDIGHPNSNVMQDKFYEFHGWIEQQYQAWQDANPGWTPPA